MSAVSKSYTFVPGTDIESAEVNQNFDDVVDYVNGEVIVRDASMAFTAIPSGPGTDPTSANQFTRKQYVDNQITASAASATSALNAAALARPTLLNYSGVLNGTAPAVATTQFSIQAGTAIVNGSGTITFTTPFPNGLVSVVVSCNDNTPADMLKTSSETKTSFGVQAWKLNAGAWDPSTGNVRISFVAVGW